MPQKEINRGWKYSFRKLRKIFNRKGTLFIIKFINDVGLNITNIR